MNKFKKFLTVIFIILCFCIIIFCAYFIYSNINDNKNNDDKIETTETEKNNSNNNKQLIVNDSQIELVHLADTLIKRLRWFSNYFSGSDFLFIYKKDILYSTDFSNEQILTSSLYNLNNEEHLFNWQDKNESVVITSDKIKKYVVELFGNIEYTDVDIPATCFSEGDGIYNSKERIYTFKQEVGCGGMAFPFINSKIEKIEKKSNQLEITEKIAYIEFDTNSTDYKYLIYNNPIDMTLVGEEPSNTLSENIDIVKKYSDKLTSYKYTFQYDAEHNNYYFQKIEKIK